MPPKAGPATRRNPSPPSQSDDDQEPTWARQLRLQMEDVQRRLAVIESQSSESVEQRLITLVDRRVREATAETEVSPTPRPHVQHAARTAAHRDLGFLHPDNDREAIYTEGKDVIYSDVTLFTRKLGRLVKRGYEVQSSLIMESLRGRAAAWLEAMTDEELGALDEARDVVLAWSQALTQQFSLQRATALAELKTTRYTTMDAAQNRPLTAYFDRISRLGRALEYSDHQVRDWVFENLWTEIQSYFLDAREQPLSSIRSLFESRQQLIHQVNQYRPPRVDPPRLPAPPEQERRTFDKPGKPPWKKTAYAGYVSIGDYADKNGGTYPEGREWEEILDGDDGEVRK